MTGHFYLWQENSSCHKKFLPMTRHFFLWREISSCNKKFLLWQEISALDLEYRLLSVTRNFFLGQLITCSANMFLPLTRKYFRHIVCDRKNSFIWQEIRKYLEVKFMQKQREFLQKFRVSLKISWEPGSLAPGNIPTCQWPTWSQSHSHFAWSDFLGKPKTLWTQN